MVSRMRELLRDSIAQADDVRRPVRGVPLRRRGLLDQRRADGGADRPAGTHLLDRAQASTPATTSCALRPSWSRSASAPTTTRSSIDESDLEAFIPQLIEHQDEPTADWTAIPQHFVARLARDTARPWSRSARARTRSSTATRAMPTTAATSCRSSACPQPMRRGLGARRRAADAPARARHPPRRGALRRRGISPIPYWGGALCFRGELKIAIAAARRPTRADSLRGRRAAVARGREAAPGGGPLPEDDLRGAQAAAVRAAIDAAGQDHDGQLGRGPGAVSRPSPRRVRGCAPAADEVSRRRRQVRAQARHARSCCPTRSSTDASRASARRWRNGCEANSANSPRER